MINFDRQGLIPAVIQDASTGEVLMVAFMNEEALHLTRTTGNTHFFSRSRNTIWRKGEQSGNVQEVRDIFINCEENSLLITVHQIGGAACHDGYRSCYYRRLEPDDSYETIAERVFDPAQVYKKAAEPEPLSVEDQQQLEVGLRKLYGVYLYLRDHDLSEQSNTSRLLQEKSQSYLVSRLADELQELADVQSGLHVHTDRQSDTALEGSQVAYWLFLLASTCSLPYGEFTPHLALLNGYREPLSDAKVIEQRQECLQLVAGSERSQIAHGLALGFAQIGWACAQAAVSPLAPMEYDLEQMRRKGLVS